MNDAKYEKASDELETMLLMTMERPERCIPKWFDERTIGEDRKSLSTVSPYLLS